MINLLVASTAAAHPYVGEYRGTFHADGMNAMEAEAKVVAEGDDIHYRVVIQAQPVKKGFDGAALELYGHRRGPEVIIGDRAGGYYWQGIIRDGVISARTQYGQHLKLERYRRHPPSEGMAPPAGAVVLLPYQQGVAPRMDAWTNPEWKALDNGAMQVRKGGNNSKQLFSDIKKFHIEFKLPLEPNNRGQGRGNSGVYFAGQYEVQVLDSFGLVHTSGDCGGLYNRARARVNACLPPETWQTYDITFRAPRLDSAGMVREHARITVYHNGILIHDDVEIPYSGDRWKGQSKATGPIHLQDHGHPVQYRNIWLLPAD
jgi:hypothetical protein